MENKSGQNEVDWGFMAFMKFAFLHDFSPTALMETQLKLVGLFKWLLDICHFVIFLAVKYGYIPKSLVAECRTG